MVSHETFEDKTIPRITWECLRETAKEKLKKRQDANEEVVEHWQSIVDGKIPFGFKIREACDLF